MSPEQAEGRVDRLSAASDVYSLGATLYHLLAGKPAFEGNDDDIVLRVQQGRFWPPRTRAARAAGLGDNLPQGDGPQSARSVCHRSRRGDGGRAYLADERCKRIENRCTRTRGDGFATTARRCSA